jgi:aminoglycoside phosphotransferase (APT) family kinase protein
MPLKTQINEALLRALLTDQFPALGRLPVRPVPQMGWGNRTFLVGDELVARLPSAAAYEAQIHREQRWLPYLRSNLPIEVPEPVAQGRPGHGYLWAWSIYRWINGDPAASAPPKNMGEFGRALGSFLNAMHRVPAIGGPEPGQDNFYRGAPLNVYDKQFRKAIALLSSQFDTAVALSVWDAALASPWLGPPIWVHGDIALGNLLVREDKLAAVIDFGQLCVGDPACDLAIAWTYFRGEHRSAFRASVVLDLDTWQRGRAWALWKAAIVAAEIVQTNAVEGPLARETIKEILADATH